MTLCKKCNHDFGLNTIAGICPKCNEYTVTTKGKTLGLGYSNLKDVEYGRLEYGKYVSTKELDNKAKTNLNFEEKRV